MCKRIIHTHQVSFYVRHAAYLKPPQQQRHLLHHQLTHHPSPQLMAVIANLGWWALWRCCTHPGSAIFSAQGAQQVVNLPECRQVQGHARTTTLCQKIDSGLFFSSSINPKGPQRGPIDASNCCNKSLPVAAKTPTGHLPAAARHPRHPPMTVHSHNRSHPHPGYRWPTRHLAGQRHHAASCSPSQTALQPLSWWAVRLDALSRRPATAELGLLVVLVHGTPVVAAQTERCVLLWLLLSRVLIH